MTDNKYDKKIIRFTLTKEQLEKFNEYKAFELDNFKQLFWEVANAVNNGCIENSTLLMAQNRLFDVMSDKDTSMDVRKLSNECSTILCEISKAEELKTSEQTRLSGSINRSDFQMMSDNIYNNCISGPDRQLEQAVLESNIANRENLNYRYTLLIEINDLNSKRLDFDSSLRNLNEHKKMLEESITSSQIIAKGLRGKSSNAKKNTKESLNSELETTLTSIKNSEIELEEDNKLIRNMESMIKDVIVKQDAAAKDLTNIDKVLDRHWAMNDSLKMRIFAGENIVDLINKQVLNSEEKITKQLSVMLKSKQIKKDEKTIALEFLKNKGVILTSKEIDNFSKLKNDYLEALKDKSSKEKTTKLVTKENADFLKKLSVFLTVLKE